MTQTTYEHWYIAGPGAIGLLLYQQLQAISEHSTTQPIMIHRSLTQGFSFFEFINIASQSQKINVQWFDHHTCSEIQPCSKHSQHHGIKQLIVTTKSYQVLDCIRQLTPYLAEGCQIVLLHNGLGIQQQAIDTWPEYRFFLGSTTEGAWKESATKVIHAGKGETQIGHIEDTQPNWWQSSLLEKSGIHWQPDILKQLHLKVAINAAINPLTILFECNNGRLLNKEYKTLVSDLCNESQRVLAAHGQSIDQLLEKVLRVAELTGRNFSSSYQDWTNNRQTELSSMNGYIQTLARLYQISTPTHDKVMEDVAKKALI